MSSIDLAGLVGGPARAAEAAGGDGSRGRRAGFHQDGDHEVAAFDKNTCQPYGTDPWAPSH